MPAMAPPLSALPFLSLLEPEAIAGEAVELPLEVPLDEGPTEVSIGVGDGAGGGCWLPAFSLFARKQRLSGFSQYRW